MNWKQICLEDLIKEDSVKNEFFTRQICACGPKFAGYEKGMVIRMKVVLRKIVTLLLIGSIVLSGSVEKGQAAPGGYIFKYKGVSVQMHSDASKIIKKAGKVLKKKETKSCAYKGLDRVYQYKDFILATYSNSKKGKQYVNGIKFRTKNISTKEGIKIGSSLNDVVDKYGKAKDNFGVYTYKKGKSKLQFEIINEKVTTIQYVAI